MPAIKHDADTPANILRANRKAIMNEINDFSENAAHHETLAENARGAIAISATLHQLIGDAIKTLEGPDAPLDFPDEASADAAADDAPGGIVLL